VKDFRLGRELKLPKDGANGHQFRSVRLQGSTGDGVAARASRAAWLGKQYEESGRRNGDPLPKRNPQHPTDGEKFR